MQTESKLAAQAKLDLVALTQSMTPEQRLEAFLMHSQLMMELYKAGQEIRSKSGRLPK
ncbi:MAG TPA: hypothetical protein VK686_17770 [Bryobacteraceae bacterium]|jgi:hypothetical protein|nr:hypothetical protein [Bryobacteraceae bacterium]